MSVATELSLNLPEAFRAVAACPGCGVPGALPVGRPAPGWYTEVMGHVFWHPDYEVQHCKTCGLYFKNRVLGDEALTEYYRILPFESFESGELFPTDRLVISAVARAEPGAKVLDFGCGVGRILKHLTARHICYGVDVNERACEVARANGVTILPESTVISCAERGFDFVILSDVFEHLAEPLWILHKLTDILKPGGKLIISTGNGDAVRTREYLSHFWYFRAPGHLQMLSLKHLNWVAGQLGLKVVDYRATSHYYTPLKQRTRQYLHAWAFEQFHLKPNACLTRLSRHIPRLCRAEHWLISPAVTCTPDHVVAVLTKRGARVNC